MKAKRSKDRYETKVQNFSFNLKLTHLDTTCDIAAFVSDNLHFK